MARFGYIFISGLAALVLLSLDWYTFQGVQTLTSGLGPAGTGIEVGVWMLFTFVALGFIGGMTARRLRGRSSLFVRVVSHAFLILFAAQLVLMTVLLAEDLYRLAAAAFTGFELPGRSRLVSQLGLLLASVPALSLVYGIAKGKHDYRVHHHTLYFDDLPRAFDGFRITQVSDIHAGSFRSVRAVQKGIDLIMAQHADLFVFTGDLVNNRAEEISPWLDRFGRISAPFGKYAVLGNHDYGDYVPWKSRREKEENLAQLFRYHAAMGHNLLMNENVRIRKEGEEIVLIGVENWGRGFSKRGDLQQALTAVKRDDFKILLSHDPSHWDAQVRDHDLHIHLTMAGHTHGMQFGIEVAGLKWSPVKYRYPHWAGLISANDRYLHVNRGFGFLGFEGRFGIWPEITVIELRKLPVPAAHETPGKSQKPG